MSLIRWTPIWDPFEEMEEVVGRLPAVGSFGQMQKGFVPVLDMYETKDAVVVETPLAGVRPEEVDVIVEKGILTVKGESKKEHEVDEKNYYRKEVRSGSFFRQVALPVGVKEDKARAEFVDGVLRITCPKAASTQVKKISVKVAKKEKK